MLSYTKFSYRSFTIQFDIGAICSGIEYTTFMDDCRLRAHQVETELQMMDDNAATEEINRLETNIQANKQDILNAKNAARADEPFGARYGAAAYQPVYVPQYAAYLGLSQGSYGGSVRKA